MKQNTDEYESFVKEHIYQMVYNTYISMHFDCRCCRDQRS